MTQTVGLEPSGSAWVLGRGGSPTAPAGWGLLEARVRVVVEHGHDTATTRGMARSTCPVFKPSLEEFTNFEAFVAKIEPIAAPVGIAKIIPPAGWWPRAEEARSIDPPSGAASTRLGDTRIRTPVKQHVVGGRGIYTLALVEQVRNATASSVPLCRDVFVAFLTRAPPSSRSAP